jgi:hypothetical protein
MGKKSKLPEEVLAFFREHGSKGGRIGGKVCAARLTPARRQEIARQAAQARWGDRGKKPGVPSEPVWQAILNRMKSVPKEDLALLPKDGASQIDHYIYSVPKREL